MMVVLVAAKRRQHKDRRVSTALARTECSKDSTKALIIIRNLRNAKVFRKLHRNCKVVPEHIERGQVSDKYAQGRSN